MNDTLPDRVLEFLRAHAGEDFTADMIASKFKITGPTARMVLSDMAGAHLIRRSSAERSPRFYVASASQVEAAQRAAQAPVFRPLTVTRERRELYERLAVERSPRP